MASLQLLIVHKENSETLERRSFECGNVLNDIIILTVTSDYLNKHRHRSLPGKGHHERTIGGVDIKFLVDDAGIIKRPLGANAIGTSLYTEQYSTLLRHRQTL
jgi:hypothetical protein